MKRVPLRDRAWLTDPALALAVAVLSVPTFIAGWVDLLDGSWMLGSSLAGQLGLHWGADLAFTYGPLGWLYTPIPFTAILVAGGLCFWVGTFAVVAWCAARMCAGLGRGPAWILAFLAASLPGMYLNIAAPVVAITLGGLVALRAGAGRVANRWLVVMAAACGPLTLLKFNVGVVAGCWVVVLAIMSAPRLRRLGLVAGTGVLAIAASWLLAGQSAGDLGAFLIDSLQLALGYSHAMGNYSNAQAGAGVLALAPLLFAATMALGWLGARGPVTARVGQVAGLAIVGTGMWMQAFTRFDPGHAAIFFATMGPIAVCLAAAATPAAMEPFPKVTLLLATYAMGALPMLLVLGSVNADRKPLSWTALIHPQTSAAAVADATSLLSSGSARAAIVAGLSDGFAAQAQLPPNISAALVGRRVHAEPYEVGAMWSAGATWAPVPIYQTYSAYTSYLDNRNLEVLKGATAPERILRRSVALDYTNPLWESPRLQIGYACRYRQVQAAPPWSVLERSTDRCGLPVDLGTVTATAGEPVAVPRTSTPALVTLDLRSMGTARASLKCDDRDYAIAQGLPSGPLLVAYPASVGWTAGTAPASCTTVTFPADAQIRWTAIPLAG